MYGTFTYIYPKNHPTVGKYTIHGASGNYNLIATMTQHFDDSAPGGVSQSTLGATRQAASGRMRVFPGLPGLMFDSA